MNHINKISRNLGNDNLEKLRKVFPEFVKDGIVDFDALKVFFEKDGKFTDNQEKYGLNWAGKSNAFNAIKTPATGTITPDEKESKDFKNTNNLFIEGDNLEVLKLLQKHYREQIKMIYIDPPYNTGKDFIYKDNFTEDKSDYYERTGQNAGGIAMTTNRDSSGRYHSDWLTMMYPRLFLARNLLKEDGVIFISIDDNEVANLRLIMDEIFGEENFVDCIIWKKRYGGGAKEKYLVSVHEYILFYAKDLESLDEIYIPTTSDDIDRYYKQKDENFALRGPFRTHPLEATKSMGERKNLVYSIEGPDKKPILPKRQWLWSSERTIEAIKKGEVAFLKDKNDKWSVHTKQYLKDELGNQRETKAFSIVDDVYSQHGTNEIISLFGDAQTFSFPKPTGLIKPIINLGTESSEDDIVLDFFAGSGTTAHAVMDLNAEDGGSRKWICVQLPEMTDENSEARKAGFENIAQIARERIRRAGDKIEKENSAKLLNENKIDTGFKAYTLSKSNYRQWNTLTDKDDEATLLTQTKLFTEKPLADDFDEKSVVYEIMSKEGFSLNSETSKQQNGGVEFWIVNNEEPNSETENGKMFISFTPKLSVAQIDTVMVGCEEKDLFVCFDSALDDTTKVNILRRKFNVKVI